MDSRRLIAIGEELSNIVRQQQVHSADLETLAGEARTLIEELAVIANTPPTVPPPAHQAEFKLGDWVEVTNTYRGLKGTVGKIVRFQGKYAEVEGTSGPGAGIKFLKGTDNLIHAASPEINIDQPLPTPRPNRRVTRVRGDSFE